MRACPWAWSRDDGVFSGMEGSRGTFERGLASSESRVSQQALMRSPGGVASSVHRAVGLRAGLVPGLRGQQPCPRVRGAPGAWPAPLPRVPVSRHILAKDPDPPVRIMPPPPDRVSALQERSGEAKKWGSFLLGPQLHRGGGRRKRGDLRKTEGRLEKELCASASHTHVNTVSCGHTSGLL